MSKETETIIPFHAGGGGEEENDDDEGPYIYNGDEFESVPESVVHAVVMEGVEEIPFKAFMQKGSLETIALPNGLKTIGRCAFTRCRKLSSVTIPSTVEWIDDRAFSGCSSLENVVFLPGSRLKTIGPHAFGDCEKLTNLKMPDTVESFGSMAFYGCVKLRKLTIPKSLVTIGSAAFCNCSGLESVDLRHLKDDGCLRQISTQSFQGCTRLSEITIPETVTSIGDNVFFKSVGCLVTIFAASPILDPKIRRPAAVGYGVFRDCIVRIADPSGVLDGVKLGAAVADHCGRRAFRGCAGIDVFGSTDPSLWNLFLERYADSPSYIYYFMKNHVSEICCR